MSRNPLVDKALLDRYINNLCTEEEKQVVSDWLSDPENKLLAHEIMQKQWSELEHEHEPSFDVEKSLSKTRSRGSDHGLAPTVRGPALRPKTQTTLYARLKLAAVWIGLLGLFLSGIMLLNVEKDDQQFTRRDRTKIETSSGEIVLRLLSDGTKVWLNAQSSILFPVTFSGDSVREVWLNGEAFFEVAEDKARPFIVRASGVNIRVLGTAFNVKSYEGDSTVKTTLVRGKVIVENERGDKEVELKPNQQAVFSHATEQITLRDVRVEKHTSWNSGVLVFEDDNVYDVITSLERWYGITIHVQDVADIECRLTARIEKESLRETLEMLRSLTDIRYIIKGNDVFIKGKICQP